MNLKTVTATAFAAVATFAAVGVQASETYGYPGYDTPYTSTVTRAEVRQAAIDARRAGEIVEHQGSYVAAPVGEPLSRAQVRAETLEAIRLGAITRGERQVFPTQAQLESIRMAGEKAAAMQMAQK